ncbi:hypothetical protein M404DRAFT_991992 [Pisolithus tinctorius Marx 270]|uniref:Uncharacterized protein n=1 Tax=Pisolithus tinctorius Marx 270 TaxID=870435 RepID=A0A0C3Q077_PISTI|nr:hypothetical protein M404DRAFT_991992 [Pisolithus tinctorius Marx 270]
MAGNTTLDVPSVPSFQSSTWCSANWRLLVRIPAYEYRPPYSTPESLEHHILFDCKRPRAELIWFLARRI